MRNLFEPLPEANKYRDSGATERYLQRFSLARFCMRRLSAPRPTNA